MMREVERKCKRNCEKDEGIGYRLFYNKQDGNSNQNCRKKYGAIPICDRMQKSRQEGNIEIKDTSTKVYGHRTRQRNIKKRQDALLLPSDGPDGWRAPLRTRHGIRTRPDCSQATNMNIDSREKGGGAIYDGDGSSGGTSHMDLSLERGLDS
jgi:hypothetical protein